jgi:hypothetical protein
MMSLKIYGQSEFRQSIQKKRGTMRLCQCLAGYLLVASSQAFAWGADGHQVAGAIADRLIAGSHAATQVNTILGGISLQDAGVWADCAKGIDPKKDYTYQTRGEYPKCKIYETPQMEAEMSDFVRRNDTNCALKPGAGSCHRQYHYTDVAIQHARYDRKYFGTRNDDIVGAMAAAIHALMGDPTPAPFNFKDSREALRVLVHYVGDIHQPLHVGAVYLDDAGRRVNPDAGAFDGQADTRGGGRIKLDGTGGNLHTLWDDIPPSLTVSHLNAAMLKQAKAVPETDGPVFDWPTRWADDTIVIARQAFAGLTFGNLQNGNWNATLPAEYGSTKDRIQKEQLVKAGTRLAELLRTLWP